MTGSEVSGVPAPEAIRFRLGVRQRVFPLLPMTVWLGFDTVLRAVTAVGTPVFEARLLGLWIVLAAVVVVSPFGITLTPSAARVHGIRRRTIPWASVQSVRVERVTGCRVIALYEAGGHRTRLRAPLTGVLQRDRHFEEKFHVIGQWWLTHRGTDWAPAPLPQPRLSGATLAPERPATSPAPVEPPRGAAPAPDFSDPDVRPVHDQGDGQLAADEADNVKRWLARD